MRSQPLKVAQLRLADQHQIFVIGNIWKTPLNGSLSLKNIVASKLNLLINENAFSYFIYDIVYIVLIEIWLFESKKPPRYIQFMIKLFLKAKYLFCNSHGFRIIYHSIMHS